MRDFCSTADKDCIRLIVAQDLKESGIDIDSSGLANFSSLQNTTNGNTSYNVMNGGAVAATASSKHHHHNAGAGGGGAIANVTSKISHQILNTSGMHNSTNSNNFFHNTSNNFNIFQSKNSSNTTATTHAANNNTNNASETCLDNQLSGGNSKLFGVSLKQIEMVNLIVNEQTLNVPW
jgi:hypothetical protein